MPVLLFLQVVLQQLPQPQLLQLLLQPQLLQRLPQLQHPLQPRQRQQHPLQPRQQQALTALEILAIQHEVTLAQDLFQHLYVLLEQ